MFKIYKLRIQGIEPYNHKEPADFVFSPFFTLIRGGNGAGKTTVLESLALFGHCSVMKATDEKGNRWAIKDRPCYVNYTVILGECPFGKIKGVEELEKLAETWKKILNGSKNRVIQIQIFLLEDNKSSEKPGRDDLKEDLKNERKLETEWGIAGDEMHVTFIRKIIEFSRPKLISSERMRIGKSIDEILRSERQQIFRRNYRTASGKITDLAEAVVRERASSQRELRLKNIEEILKEQTYSIVTPGKEGKAIDEIVGFVEDVVSQGDTAVFSEPPRAKYLKGEKRDRDGKEIALLEHNSFLPPLVCYFNTDMYHYGLGLDIRESPKHLSAELFQLVGGRLHMIKYNPDGGAPIGEIANFKSIQRFWEKVYKDLRNETLMSITFREGTAGISVGKEGQDATSYRKFLSSGENQTLSLGLVFGALQPAHSIILLDEPDLHLSLPAGIRMYNEIFTSALLMDIQVIVVSHLPFIFPNSHHSPDKTKDSDSFIKFHEEELSSLQSDRNVELKNGSRKKPEFKCVTFYYLKKDTDANGNNTIIREFQKKGAKMAGEFQNMEIEAVLRQSLAPTPKIGIVFLGHLKEYVDELIKREKKALPKPILKLFEMLQRWIKHKIEA